MKRKDLTQQEMLCFAEFAEAEVTTQEVTFGDLTINSTDEGFMVEGPGGVDVGGTLEEVLNLMRSHNEHR